jgi:hypothetical protein
MYLKSPARVAIIFALLATVGACSKKADQEQAPAVQAAIVPPPPAMPADVAAPSPDVEMKTQTPKPSYAIEEKRKELEEKSSPEATEPGTKVTAGGVDRSAQLTSGAISYTDGERKFIRTANMNFRVKDVYLSANAIEDVVAHLNGFVTQNNIASQVQATQRRPLANGKLMEISQYTVRGELIVRVPSPKTQEFLRLIADQIAFLDQRNFSAHDAQFDMLRKQLEYARNEETQEELGQASREGGKLAQRVDAINSRNETKATRDEARVQKKEFEDQVAFSTVNFTIYQSPNIVETEVKDVDAIFIQERPGFLTRLAAACHAGWDNLLDHVIDSMEFWPFWIVLLSVAILLIRVRQRRRIARAVK